MIKMRMISFIKYVLRIPIRNWNANINHKHVTKMLVLRIPIRNWNTEMFGLGKEPSVGFKDTYEELKHTNNELYEFGNDSFKDTYKELKQIILVVSYWISWAF